MPPAGPTSLLALAAAVTISGLWGSLDVGTLSTDSTGLHELSPGVVEADHPKILDTSLEREPKALAIEPDSSQPKASCLSDYIFHVLAITAGLDAFVFIFWMLSRMRFRCWQLGGLASESAFGRPTLETGPSLSCQEVSNNLRADFQVEPPANDVTKRENSTDLAKESKKQPEPANMVMEAGVDMNKCAPELHLQSHERQCLSGQAEPLPDTRPLGCKDGCTAATCDHCSDVSSTSTDSELSTDKNRHQEQGAFAYMEQMLKTSTATDILTACSDKWSDRHELQSVPEHGSIDDQGPADDRADSSSQLGASNSVRLRDVPDTPKMHTCRQKSMSVPRKHVKIQGFTEQYLLKCGVCSVREWLLLSHNIHAALSSKLMCRSFFKHLLADATPLRNMPANDVAAAQWDLRYLGLESLLELRIQNSDLVTESRSHESHCNFLAALDRQLFEHLARRLITAETLQSGASFPGKEVLHRLGLQFAMVLGAAETLPRPAANALASRDAVETSRSLQHESAVASNDEEMQLIKELNILRAEILEERRLQEKHDDVSWRRFCRRCCWALPLADGVWPPYCLVLLCGTDESGCASAQAKLLIGDSAEEIAAAAAGRAVATIRDQSKSTGGPRQVHWEVKFLDPQFGDVLAELSRSRDLGQCNVPPPGHAEELVAALERRRAKAASEAAVVCSGEQRSPHRPGLLMSLPTPSRASARAHVQNRTRGSDAKQ